MYFNLKKKIEFLQLKKKDAVLQYSTPLFVASYPPLNSYPHYTFKNTPHLCSLVHPFYTILIYPFQLISRKMGDNVMGYKNMNCGQVIERES